MIQSTGTYGSVGMAASLAANKIASEADSSAYFQTTLLFIGIISYMPRLFNETVILQ